MKQRRGARYAQHTAGFTLVELLIVVALLGTLLGMGLGLFARLDLGDRVVRTQVVGQVRAARNFAVAREASAVVVLDHDQRRVQASGLAVVGTWHFEEATLAGAFGHMPSAAEGRLIDDGFQGKALDFTGLPDGSHAAWPVHTDPAWDPRDGFSVALAVKRTGQLGGTGGGGSVLRLGDSLGLEIEENGVLRMWFAPELVSEDKTVRKGGRVFVETEPGAVPAGRWCTLDARYDRVRMEVAVDGVVRARLAEDAAVWRAEGPLRLCGANAPFQGAIDRLVVACAVREDGYQLPPDVRFSKETPRLLRFAAGGTLDRELHAEPVVITLLRDDGPNGPIPPEVITVQLSGAVE